MNKLKKYAIRLEKVQYVTLNVEAENRDAAVDKALDYALHRVCPWEDDGDIDIIDDRLLADPDTLMLEAMLEVLHSAGFETRDMHALDGSGEHIGYYLFGSTQERELLCSHKICCEAYAEGLTPDNFLCEWEKLVDNFDPAWQTISTLADLETHEQANNLRDILDDWDNYTKKLHRLSTDLAKACIAVDSKKES